MLKITVISSEAREYKARAESRDPDIAAGATAIQKAFLPPPLNLKLET